MKMRRMWQLIENGPYVKIATTTDRKSKMHTTPGVTKSGLQNESVCVQMNKTND